MVVDAARSVRGYALVLLLVTVACCGPLASDGARLRYALCIGLAIGTHLYAVMALAVHVAWAWSERRKVLPAAAAAAAIGLALRLPSLAGTLSVADERRGEIRPGFPWEVARELLGRSLPAVLATGALAGWALRNSASKTPPGARCHAEFAGRLRRAGVVFAGCFVAVWVVLHPRDLYPRFLVWAVPWLAAGIAVTLRERRGALATCVAVAAIALAPQLPAWNDEPVPSRRIVAAVDALAPQRPCVAAGWREAFFAYGLDAAPLATDRGAVARAARHGCDVVVLPPGSSAILPQGWTTAATVQAAEGRWVVLRSPRR